MDSRSLEYDEIDVVPLTPEEFIRNVKLRAENHINGKWYKIPEGIGARFSNEIQFRNVEIAGDKLTIKKSWRFGVSNLDSYNRVHGEIYITFKQLNQGTELKAKVVPEKFITKISAMVMGSLVGMGAAFLYALDAGAVPVIVATLLSIFIFFSWTINERESQLALTKYYKDYLFNIINT